MNHCAIARANAENPTWSLEAALRHEAALLLRMPLAQRRLELAAPARAGRRQALEDEMRRQFEQRRAA